MTINKAKLERAVEEAKAKTNDPKWLRAIDKAAAAILSGEMIVTTLAHGALVTTANGTYAANGHCNTGADVQALPTTALSAAERRRSVEARSCDFQKWMRFYKSRRE